MTFVTFTCDKCHHTRSEPEDQFYFRNPGIGYAPLSGERTPPICKRCQPNPADPKLTITMSGRSGGKSWFNRVFGKLLDDAKAECVVKFDRLNDGVNINGDAPEDWSRPANPPKAPPVTVVVDDELARRPLFSDYDYKAIAEFCRDNAPEDDFYTRERLRIAAMAMKHDKAIELEQTLAGIKHILHMSGYGQDLLVETRWTVFRELMYLHHGLASELK